MSSDNPTKKPTPTVAEINAYLDESAARTRKRLPLALGQPAPKALASLPTKGAKLEVRPAKRKAATGDDKDSKNQWQPFSTDSESSAESTDDKD